MIRLVGVQLLLLFLLPWFGSPALTLEHVHSDTALLLSARQALRSGDFGLALRDLRHSLQDGFPRPGSLLHDDEFRALVDSAEWRSSFRKLLYDFAIAPSGTLCAESRSEPFVLHGVVRSSRGGSAIASTRLEFVQADADGKYFSERGLWNPRLFLTLVTDSLGRFTVYSERPGSYADEGGQLAQSHLHFSAQARGFIRRNSEILLEKKSLTRASETPERFVQQDIENPDSLWIELLLDPLPPAP